MKKSIALTFLCFVSSMVPGWSVSLMQHRVSASQEPESQAESDGTRKALEFGKEWLSKVLQETAKYGADPSVITALENITEAQVDLIPKLLAAKTKMEVLRKLVFGDAESPDTAEGQIHDLIKELTSQLNSARTELKELQVKVSQSTSGGGRQSQLKAVENVLQQTTKTIKSRGKQQWDLLQPESRALLNKMKSLHSSLESQKKAAAQERAKGKMLWIKHAKEIRAEMGDEIYKLWNEEVDLSKKFAEKNWRVGELTDEDAKAEVPKMKKSLANAKTTFKRKWDEFLTDLNASNPAARVKFEENMQFFEALEPNMSVTEARIEHIKDKFRASTDRQKIEFLTGCRLATDHLNELITVVEAVKKQPRDVRLSSALVKQTEAVRLMDQALANTTRKLEQMHKTALRDGDPKLVRAFETAEYEYHQLNNTVTKQEAKAHKAFFKLTNDTEAAIKKQRKLAVAHSAEQSWTLKEDINNLFMGHNVNRTLWESKLSELKDLMDPTESEMKSTNGKIQSQAQRLKKLWQQGGTVYDRALGAQKQLWPLIQRLNENKTHVQVKAPQAPKPQVEVPKAEVVDSQAEEVSTPAEAPVAEATESQPEEVSPEAQEVASPAEAPAAEAEEASAQPEAEADAPEAQAQQVDSQAEEVSPPAEASAAEAPESQAEQAMSPAEEPVAEVPESQAEEASTQAEEAKPLAEAPVSDAPESQGEELSPEAKASQAEVTSSDTEEVSTPAAEVPEDQSQPADSQSEEVSSEAEGVNQPAEVPEDQAQPVDSQATEVVQAEDAEVPVAQAEEASSQSDEAPASEAEEASSATEDGSSQDEAPQE